MNLLLEKVSEMLQMAQSQQTTLWGMVKISILSDYEQLKGWKERFITILSRITSTDNDVPYTTTCGAEAVSFSTYLQIVTLKLVSMNGKRDDH